jgi:hypothetical protein
MLASVLYMLHDIRMTDGNLEREPGAEQQPAQQLIGNLLPRYYEAYGENPRYEVERSIMVDGHEVAWLKYEGEVAYDITGEGKEGQPYAGHELHCACKFTEGTGWRMEEDGRPVGLMGGDGCIKKEAAIHLRHLELREEYKARDMFGQWGHPGTEELEAIMLDLMEKAKAEEFLEGTGGARFWGGYYYLQTVASIADLPMKSVWDATDKMIADKKIQLEGAVVQPYFEPAPPTWEPHTSIERDGYRIVASLPTHSKMPQTWQYEVFKQGAEGEEPVKLEIEIPQETLTYQPTFGPDVDDVSSAEARMAQILEEVTKGQ